MLKGIFMSNSYGVKEERREDFIRFTLYSGQLTAERGGNITWEM